MERYRQFLMILCINSLRDIYSMLPNDMNYAGCNLRNLYELNTIDFYVLVTAANAILLIGLYQILLKVLTLRVPCQLYLGPLLVDW